MNYADWTTVEEFCPKCAGRVQLKGKFPFKPGQARIRCQKCGVEDEATLFFVNLALKTKEAERVLSEVEEPGSSKTAAFKRRPR